MELMNPRSATLSTRAIPKPTADVAGKTIAVLNNGWRSMDVLSEWLEEQLRRRGAVAVLHEAVPIAGAPERELLEDLAGRADAAFVGLANCGSCTAWTSRDLLDLHELGLPGMLLITERFLTLARSVARGRGFGEMPEVVLPGDLETATPDEVRQAATVAFGEVWSDLGTGEPVPA